MFEALALQIVLGAIPIVGYGLVLAANVLRPGGTLDGPTVLRGERHGGEV